MIKLEIDAILHGEKYIVDVDDDILCQDLTDKICIMLNDDNRGILICPDKQGVIPVRERLSDLSVSSGERLIYVKGGSG